MKHFTEITFMFTFVRQKRELERRNQEHMKTLMKMEKRKYIISTEMRTMYTKNNQNDPNDM